MTTTTYDLVLAGAVVRSLDFEDGAAVPSLAPSKGAWLPREYAGEDFDPVAQVREGPVKTVEANRTLWTYSVRAKTDDEVAAMRASVLDQVNAEAERRILAIMPEYQQRNALALGLQLVTTAGSDPTAWPSDMKAIYDATLAQWDEIKTIRAQSNTICAAVPADPAGIAAFDVAAAWA